MRVNLPALLFAGLVLASGAVQAFDRSATGNAMAQACSATADRCIVAQLPPRTLDGTVVYGTLSDHGSTYDYQGNQIDRHGNIVAVPDDRSGGAREVFVSDMQ